LAATILKTEGRYAERIREVLLERILFLRGVDGNMVSRQDLRTE